MNKRCGTCSKGTLNQVNAMIECRLASGIIITSSPYTEACVWFEKKVWDGAHTHPGGQIACEPNCPGWVHRPVFVKAPLDGGK